MWIIAPFEETFAVIPVFPDTPLIASANQAHLHLDRLQYQSLHEPETRIGESLTPVNLKETASETASNWSGKRLTVFER